MQPAIDNNLFMENDDINSVEKLRESKWMMMKREAKKSVGL
jgi:hypothetical protein